MGKVVKFVGRMTGLIGGFITGGVDNALASLKFSLAVMSGNPYLIAATVGADFYQTFLARPPSTTTGAPVVFRQSVSNSFIVYGRRRVGGLLVFFHSKKNSSDKKHYRYFVIAVAGHRCAGNPTWMLNDETVTVDGSGKVTTGPYADAAWLWFDRGTATATANATFVSETDGKWTTDHKGIGVAKIYAKFRMNDDVIEAGMPNITAVIDGKDEVYDPRDESTGYTNNGILVAYDFMALAREEGGFGAYADEIPDADWISAQANVCDETVEGEARYALDGVITTGAPPSQIRDILITNLAGSYTFSEGKHLIRPGYYVPPSETLVESDLAGPIQVSPFLTSDQAANEVQGTYYEPSDGFQTAPFATKTSDPAPEDVRQVDLDLPFITSKHRGERIASIMLRRAAAEKTVAWPMNITGLKVGALDVVQLATDRYGLSNYAWLVTNWSFSSDFGVVLNLREENEEIYAEPDVITPDSVDTIDVPEPLITGREASMLVSNSSTRPTQVLTTSETGGVATITMIAHDRIYSADGLVTTLEEQVFTGLLTDTPYYLHYVDLGREDTVPTITVSTSSGVDQEEPGRHDLGRMRTPIADSGITYEGGGAHMPGSVIGREVEA